MSDRVAVLQDGGLQPLGTSLRPEITALISTEIGYATANRAALTHPDPRVMADRTIHPRTKGLRNTEFQQAVGDAALQS